MRGILLATTAAALLLSTGCSSDYRLKLSPSSAEASSTTTEAPPTLSRTEIEDTAKGSMQQTFDTDERFATVRPVQVVRMFVALESGNTYRGLATIRSAAGTQQDVPVEVTVDGARVLWQTEPGGLSWLAPAS